MRFRSELIISLVLKYLNNSGLLLEFRASHWQVAWYEILNNVGIQLESLHFLDTKSPSTKSCIDSFRAMIDNCDGNQCAGRNFIFKVTFNVQSRMDELGEFAHLLATRLFEFNFRVIINYLKVLITSLKTV